MKKLPIILTAIIAVLALFLGIVRFLSRPGEGRIASENLGIPHRLVIAHRGASYNAPEGTAPAYIMAREAGADYLEMDIQRTRDGVLFAYHDETFERTTNVRELYPGREGAPVGGFTLREIKSLDAGSWFNARYPERAQREYRGLKILTFDEVIGIAGEKEPRPGLYIESKDQEFYPGIEKDITDRLRARGWIGQAATHFPPVIFQSFDKGSLLRFKALAPEAPRIYLVDEEMEEEFGWEKIVEDAAAAGHGMGVVGYLGYPRNTGKAHSKNLVVHIYTINAPWQFRIFDFCGTDGFFTDRADVLMKYYGKKN